MDLIIKDLIIHLLCFNNNNNNNNNNNSNNSNNDNNKSLIVCINYALVSF